MLKFLIALSFAFGALGCATTHPGSMLQSESKEIVISVDQQSDLSDKYYLFYEYTIENKSSEWKELQITNVYFDGQQTETLEGEKLSAWIEGAELKLKAAEYNDALLLGSVVAVSGVVATTSHNSNLQAAGAVGLVGGAAVDVSAKTLQAQRKGNSGLGGEGGVVNVPRTHVFVPTKVAPESYVRRWIVVRAPASANKKKPSYAGGALNQEVLISKVRIDGTKDAQYSALVPTTWREFQAESH